MSKIPLLVLALLPSLKIFSQPPYPVSEKEKKILAYIDQHLPETRHLLANAVHINSGTLNKTGVKKTGDIFAVELRKAGFSTEWVCLAGDPGSRGAGDISYIAKYVDCIDGLGASGRGAHTPGETINLTAFPPLIKRAALILYRLTNPNTL